MIKLRSLVRSPDKDIGAAAAEALTQMNQLGNIYRRVMLNPSRPELLYRADCWYDADAQNGGHQQYLGNFEPADYRHAIDGLRDIGAPERGAILEKALSIFGHSGPPADRARRRAIVYDDLTDAQYEILRELDQQYYDGEENVERLLGLCAVDSKADFNADQKTLN